MKTRRPLWLVTLFVVLALMLAACAGGTGQQAAPEGGADTQPEPAPAPAPPAGEQAATIDTTCQVQLPAEGEGSAQGMTDDPVATAASNNPALSTLVTAVQQAGLVDTLNNLGTATVFAPSNEAFAKIPPETLNTVLADRELLTSILTLHVVPEQKLDAQQLVSMGSAPTVNGQQITFSAQNGQLMVNGQATTVCPNVRTANATVHIIDTVLMPEG
jgi:uncharacterized surface protein with fasciclin (FAS1) repeats